MSSTPGDRCRWSLFSSVVDLVTEGMQHEVIIIDGLGLRVFLPRRSGRGFR